VGEVAAQYRRRADAFERLVAATPPDRWGAPSPCDGWTASDVVAHVVDFSAQVMRERVGVEDAPRFADAGAPLEAFRATRAAVERVLDDPATPPEMAEYLRWSLSFDLPQHGWDLAMATGQDPTIAPEEVELIWGPGDAGEFEEAFAWQRANGWYGPPVEVPADAPLQDRVLGLLGRDPGGARPASARHPAEPGDAAVDVRPGHLVAGAGDDLHLRLRDQPGPLGLDPGRERGAPAGDDHQRRCGDRPELVVAERGRPREPERVVHLAVERHAHDAGVLQQRAPAGQPPADRGGGEGAEERR
jgi:uncharacterized protein (TIGR03086 family)